MKSASHLLAFGLLCAGLHHALAAEGDFNPMAPVRPSAGLINDYLRKNDPYLAAWDLGVNTRLRYEVRDHFGIAGVPGSIDFRESGADTRNDYLLTRIKPRVGYTHEWFQAFVEGRHSDAEGDERTPSLEEDSLDLHQAYLFLGNHKEFPVSLKVGRQELAYGDERVIGSFGWNNIGRVFDAAKLRWQNSWFAADAFVSKVVLPDDNNFNMHNDYDYFSGIYATTKKIPHQTTDIYFLSRNANAQSPIQPGSLVPGASARDIYTIGMRVKSNPGDFGPWDYSAEVLGQWGHFNDTLLPNPVRSLEHQAWAAYIGGGYTFVDTAYTPRLGLEYNYSTGDGNPTDDKHETLDNLFPTNHKFYGYMDFFSLQNIHNVRFTSSIKPLPRLTLLGEAHAFWLADTSDSFYTAAGGRRGGLGRTNGNGYGINSQNDSYVGSEIDFIASYAISPLANVELGYGHFFTGNYIDQSLSSPAFGSSDANWVYLQLVLNF
ncbi:MAG: alginate export family protein [Verrucomicrobiales bacterium]